MTLKGCFADWQLGCGYVHGGVAVVGWDQSCRVWRVLREICFQGSFCCLTWKKVSFWLGKQLCHLFGPGEVTAGTMLGGEMAEGERRPEMLCEELGGRGNPAAFPLPLQWFPSATAASSPQPCSSSSRSGSATQRCHKAQVSTCNVPCSLGLKA